MFMKVSKYGVKSIIKVNFENLNPIFTCEAELYKNEMYFFRLQA